MIHMKRALEIYGNQSNLAEALGVSKSAVSQWKGVIPILQQYRLKYVVAPNLFKREKVE